MTDTPPRTAGLWTIRTIGGVVLLVDAAWVVYSLATMRESDGFGVPITIGIAAIGFLVVAGASAIAERAMAAVLRPGSTNETRPVLVMTWVTIGAYLSMLAVGVLAAAVAGLSSADGVPVTTWTVRIAIATTVLVGYAAALFSATRRA